MKAETELLTINSTTKREQTIEENQNQQNSVVSLNQALSDMIEMTDKFIIEVRFYGSVTSTIGNLRITKNIPILFVLREVNESGKLVPLLVLKEPLDNSPYGSMNVMEPAVRGFTMPIFLQLYTTDDQLVNLPIGNLVKPGVCCCCYACPYPEITTTLFNINVGKSYEKECNKQKSQIDIFNDKNENKYSFVFPKKKCCSPGPCCVPSVSGKIIEKESQNVVGTIEALNKDTFTNSLPPKFQLTLPNSFSVNDKLNFIVSTVLELYSKFNI